MTLRLWDVASGTCIREFQGHSHLIGAVRLSNDARWGLSGSWDRTTRLWDMVSGDCVQVFEGHGHYVSAVDLSSDGQWAVSGSSDTTVRLWNVGTGRCVRIFEGIDEVSAVAFVKDSRLVLSANYGKTLQLWDCTSGNCVRSFHGHTDSVTGFCMAEGARRLLSAGNDRTLRVWDLDSGRCLRTLEAGENNKIYLSPDGTLALSASNRSQICLWNLQSLSSTALFKAPYLICKARSAGEITNAQRYFDECIRQAKQTLSTRNYPTALAVLRAARSIPGYEQSKVALDLWYQIGAHSIRTDLRGAWCVRTFGKHTEAIRAVSLKRNGQLAASVSHEYSGTLRIWDAASGECVRVFPECNFSDGFALDTDWRSLIWGGGEVPFGLWDVASGKCIRRFESDIETVGAHGRSLALSKDGVWLFSDGIEVVKQWQVATGRCVREYVGHTDLVACVAVNRSGSLVISGSSDNTVRLWDVASGGCLRCLEGHTSTVRAVCLSGDEKWILSGSWDGTLRLWDIGTGRCSRLLEGHVGESAVALTGDNKWAFSASGIWELSSGRRIWSFSGDTNLFTTVALSEDNRWAVFGAKDGALQLWELDWDYKFP